MDDLFPNTGGYIKKPYEVTCCDACSFVQMELMPSILEMGFFSSNYNQINVHHIDSSKLYFFKLLRITMISVNNKETPSISLVVKVQKKSVIPIYTLMDKELLIHKMIKEHFHNNLVLKPYLSTYWKVKQFPVVVSQDLKASGYVRSKNKLDEEHLILCMKALALFHADTFKIMQRKGTNTVLLEQVNHLKSVRSLKSEIRKFTYETSIWAKLGNTFSKKIKHKLLRIYLDKQDTFKTIIHDRFVRSTLWFKYEDGRPCDVKIADWHSVKIGSAAIDFSRLLLTNLPDVSQSETFCRKMFQIYLDTIRRELTALNARSLEKHFMTWLFISYINFNFYRYKQRKDCVKILHVFDKLRAFDD